MFPVSYSSSTNNGYRGRQRLSKAQVTAWLTCPGNRQEGFITTCMNSDGCWAVNTDCQYNLPADYMNGSANVSGNYIQYLFATNYVMVHADCNNCALQWRYNGRGGASNHRRLCCLLNHLFERRSIKTSKLRVTGLCEGNPPVTGGFPSQGTSNTENVSIWWCHHGKGTRTTK